MPSIITLRENTAKGEYESSTNTEGELYFDICKSSTPDQIRKWSGLGQYQYHKLF